MRGLARSAAAAGAPGRVAGARVWVIARTASRRVRVNGTRSGVGDSGACCPAARAPWMRSSWVVVIQARISCVTWCGVPERRIGPREGPAPVIADLSCPIVVPGAPRRRGYYRPFRDHLRPIADLARRPLSA